MIEHEILILPAFDKRHTDPSKSYGIHGCEMVFYAKGASGAIQFVLYTQWYLPHVQKELSAKCKGGSSYCPQQPPPADIGYHSKVPMYDGQEPMNENCKLTGGRCYYDGSGLQAEQYYEILVRGGLDALWEALDQCYYDTFLPKNRRAASPGRGAAVSTKEGKNLQHKKLLYELVQIQKELLPGTPGAVQMGAHRLGCLIEQLRA